MKINYISIESVLFGLSTILEESDWNENNFKEWAYTAAKKMANDATFEDFISIQELKNHKSIIPSRVKYINSIFFKSDSLLNSDIYAEIFNLADVRDNPSIRFMDNPEALPMRAQDLLRLQNGWTPLKRSFNPFMKSIHCDNSFIKCPSCIYEYSISPSLVLSSTAKEGVIIVSYKSYPVDQTGEMLIPDDENFKEAIQHYCLYRMYVKKVLKNIEGAFRERDYHLQRYNTLMLRAKSINLPDVDQLESIKNNHNKLIQNNEYNTAFSSLGASENIRY